PMAPTTPASPEVLAEVAAGLNAFGLDLYREVAATPGDQVISPASVSIALTMAHAGAKGETAAQIEQALHMSRPVPEVWAAVSTMITGWNEPHEGTELAVVNRLFGDTKVAYEPTYLELTKTVFQAPLESVDFRGAPEPARVRINDWVADQTHDRIQDLLPPASIDDSTRLVLVNAIYFKSQWQDPFEEGATSPAPFFASSGAHDVPTMHATHHYGFAEPEGAGVQVLELPYEAPGLAMTLLVPTAKDGLAAVEGALSAETLAGWVAAAKGERLALALPKFRIAPAESLRLAKLLGQLGIQAAFSADADLTGMAPSTEQLMFSECFHKGFIEVDEKGTEAAAATALVAVPGGAPPVGEPRTVTVDRPFLYLIRDTRSGLVLFVGRVVDPTTA
ncbi:MAG: serpin family protein, partial [Myxococcales bacterium]|nr:serpin family protein [Myxococcales bacterium]